MRLARVRTSLAQLILVALIMAAWIGIAQSQELKIAKVDLDQVYRGSARIRTALTALQKVEVDGKAKLLGLNSEIKALEDRLKNEEKALTAEEKRKLEESLTSKREERQTEKETLEVTLQFRRRNERTRFTKEIDEIVKSLAEKEGFTVVVKDQMFLYSRGVRDLTSDVIKAMDAKPEPAEEPKQSDQK
ncbi:MAG: OmpH family outer membrane protein [Deltaproteobacteria bacterium]|nr:OmpH family outer membrane protein [Deltaproteobacteria bacterium]